ARQMFSITQEVIGRPFQDLELSYRPVELRSSLDQMRADKRSIHLAGVERYSTAGERTHPHLRLDPLGSTGDVGALITFVDVTHHRRIQDELEEIQRELETTNEELQSTNEELETTNEELQSTIEELETTNEELQSTNEELET